MSFSKKPKKPGGVGRQSDVWYGHRGVEELVAHSGEKSNNQLDQEEENLAKTWVWELLCVNQAQTCWAQDSAELFAVSPLPCVTRPC